MTRLKSEVGKKDAGPRRSATVGGRAIREKPKKEKVHQDWERYRGGEGTQKIQSSVFSRPERF